MRVDQSDPGPTPARGRGLLPLQPPPHLGPEHQRPEEMVHDLCLQLQVSAGIRVSGLNNQKNIVRNNNPVFSHHHPQYHPLEKVDNQAILDCSNKVSSVDKDYFNPENDFSVKDKINP